MAECDNTAKTEEALRQRPANFVYEIRGCAFAGQRNKRKNEVYCNHPCGIAALIERNSGKDVSELEMKPKGANIVDVGEGIPSELMFEPEYVIYCSDIFSYDKRVAQEIF